jgi:nucleotide-binding universal stress UspA family protein
MPEPDTLPIVAPYDLRPLHFEALEQLEFDEWLQIGQTLHDMGQSLSWWLGDWWVYGETHFGEEHSQGAPTDFRSQKTIANAASVCSRITPDRRRAELSYSHHAVVAYLDPPKGDEWLQTAIDEGLSVHKLRDRIRAINVDPDLEPIPEPEPDRPDKPAPPPVNGYRLRALVDSTEAIAPEILAEWASPEDARALRHWCAQLMKAIDQQHAAEQAQADAALDEIDTILNAPHLDTRKTVDDITGPTPTSQTSPKSKSLS